MPEFKRTATLMDDGMVVFHVGPSTKVSRKYCESMHDEWPDLERPKKPKRGRPKKVKDDAQGNAEPDSG